MPDQNEKRALSLSQSSVVALQDLRLELNFKIAIDSPVTFACTQAGCSFPPPRPKDFLIELSNHFQQSLVLFRIGAGRVTG